MIKTIIVLLNFAFKCRLVNETHTIAIVQVGMQPNQLASMTDCTGNITNFTKNGASKNSFFLKTQKRSVL